MIDPTLLYNYSKELNILYVEDDININASTLDVFEDYFSKVECAIDGKDGLEKYQQFHSLTNKYFDIVITDINMPKLNGIDMISQIKTINKKQNFLVISAHSDSDKLLKLIDLGINHFLLKPISLEKLVEKLYTICQIAVNKKNEKKYLISQSKNAAMGEMIDMIAHQWLAQVNIMKMRSDITKSEISDGYIQDKDIEEFFSKQIEGFNHLTQTLNEFRGFFKQNSKLETIELNKLLNSVTILLKDNLVKNMIDLKIDIPHNFEINVIPNEFKHVFINLIQNSIEAFEEHNKKDRTISIRSYKINNKTHIEYIDNAGGIEHNLLKSIYKKRFTTKSQGTGMGMYLIKLILDKIDVDIEVKNFKNGVKFILTFNGF